MHYILNIFCVVLFRCKIVLMFNVLLQQQQQKNKK